MTEQEEIKEIEELLDISYKQAIATDELLGNEEYEFLESNPDWKFYDGLLTALRYSKFTYDRIDYKHKVYVKEWL